MGVTPLSLSIREEKQEMIEVLTSAGADVNVLEKGKTQLRLAAAGGKLELVTALLEAGADPNVNNTDEQTPLRSAAGGGTARVLFFQHSQSLLLTSIFLPAFVSDQNSDLQVTT